MATALRWGGTGAFLWTEVRVQFHEGLAIATSMVVQVVLLVFVYVLAPSLLVFALLGAVVYSVFMIGQRVQNEAAYVRIDHKLNELYHASPLSAEAYFLAMAGGVLLAYLPPILGLAALLEVVHPLPLLGLVALVLALAALWLFTSSLGYVISTLFRDMRAIWPWASLLTNLFGVLPPVFYPLPLLPPAAAPVAVVLPPSAAAILVEAAAGFRYNGVAIPPTVGDVVLAAASLAVEAAALFAFAVYWARRQVRRV
jgi:ABC-2 type transport system permease protein